MLYDNYKICLQCDLLVEINVSKHLKNKFAACPRCDCELIKYHNTNTYASIYALSALLILFLSVLSNIFNFYIYGQLIYISLISMNKVLISLNFLFLSVLFFCVVFLLPIIFLLCIIISSVKINIPDSLRINTLLLIEHIKPWCMADIFLLSLLVSFVKLQTFGIIYPDNGLYVFILYIILQIAAYSLFDSKRCWQKISSQGLQQNLKELEFGKTAISQRIKACFFCDLIMPINQKYCLRCKQHSKARNRDHLNIVIALSLTASLLYIPANIFPMMNSTFLGNVYSSTLLGGIIYMWQAHDYLIAIMIFAASIAIPIMKLFCLLLLLFYINHKSSKTVRSCKNYNTIYNIIKFIGRWSMLDAFVVIILSTSIDNGYLIDNKPAFGVICFSLVVIVTMIATEKYDPRFIWDKCENTDHDE